MSSPHRRRLWLAVNTLTAVAILIGVAGYFTKTLRDSPFDFSQLHVRFELLVASVFTGYREDYIDYELQCAYAGAASPRCRRVSSHTHTRA